MQEFEKGIIDVAIGWFWSLKSPKMKPEEYLNKYLNMLSKPINSSDENAYDDAELLSENRLKMAVARYIQRKENTPGKKLTGFGDYLIELGNKLNNPNSTIDELVLAADKVGMNLSLKMTGLDSE